jgi:hypothetical protein
MASSISGNVTPNPYNVANFSVYIGAPFEDLNQFVLSATIPSLNVNNWDVPLNNNPAPYPGNVVKKTDLFIEFMIDENWKSYKYLFDWFERLKDTNSPNADPLFDSRADIKISAYDSTRNKEIGEFSFENCFPVSLPSIVFTHDNRSTRAEVMSIPFKADVMDFNTSSVTEDRYRIVRLAF